MKLWKHTLISTIAFIGIASSVLISSCTDDSCLKLKCRNGGTCADEKCKCPTGYEGTQCESVAVERFYGSYHGITKINELPPFIDSAFVTVASYPNQIIFRRGSRWDDTIRGTIGANGIVSMFDPKYGGRDIVMSVEGEKFVFNATERLDGKVQNINFTATLRYKK